jgi:carbon monoxide dehydrogenase subunit G
MKVTGGATLHAPVSAVWAALNDPAVLVQTIPGCERLTATAEDTYALTVTAGVGTITGTYTGQIALADRQPPTALTLRASGAGTPGTVDTTVLVQLADNSNVTVLRYDADATIGGMIAGVGQRMLAAVAKRQATQFFQALDALLLAQAAGAGAAPPGEAAGPAGGGRPAAAALAGEVAAGLPGEPATGAFAGQGQAAEPGPPGPAVPGPPGAAGPGQSPAGAAGVSSPADAATRGASGMIWERSTAAGQPAGRRGAGPQPAGQRGASPPTGPFVQGAVVGAAIALAGVLVGGLIARRKR